MPPPEKTCFLCGHPIPKRRWWQFSTNICRPVDEPACRERFVTSFMRGNTIPPANPGQPWVILKTTDDDADT